MTEHPAQERIHALDAVRGIALLLGIVLHGTMSFMPGLEDMGFPISDQSKSDTLGIVFYVIHVFRMAAFFLIAGFFARLIFHRRGFKSFVKDRSKRILIPLVSLFLPVFIAINAVVVWAVYKYYGTLTPENPIQMPQADFQGFYFPLMHFWFLYILAWLYVFSLSCRWIVVKLDGKEKLRHWLDRLYATLINTSIAAPVLAIPVAVALYLIPNWWWGGVPTPDQSLVPIWVTLFIYGYVFTLGWILERQRHLLKSIQKQTWANLVLGTVAVVVCLNIAGWRGDLTATPTPDWHWVYAFSYAIALVALSLAFIGGGMTLFSKENPIIRYLADGSYWIYVLHLPVVFAFQTWLMDVALHWSIKFPLILFLSCMPLVLSYHWFVRATWIGNIMNGRRYPREWPSLQSA